MASGLRTSRGRVARAFSFLSTVSLLAALSGCGTPAASSEGADSAGGRSGGTGAAGTAGQDSADPDAVEGPLYLVRTSLLTLDVAVSYMATVASLAAGATLDLGRALEFGGGARAYGPERADVVYVTSSEEPTLTEVTLGSDGSPRRGRVVSLGQEGVTGTTGGNLLYFVSSTKAYFISQETQELIVWDPSKMETVKTVSLEIPFLPSSTFIVFNPQPIVVAGTSVIWDPAALRYPGLVLSIRGGSIVAVVRIGQEPTR